MASIPSILVEFIQRATSLIARSERGIATLIIRDDTNEEFDIKKYTSIPEADADSALYTSDNLQQIRDVLTFAPYMTYVVRIGTEGTLADALAIIERNVKTGWIGVANAKAEDAAALVSWIKAKEQRQIYYRAVVYNGAAPDNKQIVNFASPKVTFADARGEKTGDWYVASLIGILASCNIKRGSTNYLCSNLVHVEETEDNEAAVEAGKLVLYNADVDEVRILSGCNSLTTTNGTTATEDMQYIETVEAMNLIADDIRTVFRDVYLGNYRNNLDNQMLFIASVNAYFRELAQPGTDVLDREYDNLADIDVEAQRSAWLGTGKDEAAEWDDDKVKKMAFKRSVFIAANIKILGSMENLKFTVNMA